RELLVGRLVEILAVRSDVLRHRCIRPERRELAAVVGRRRRARHGYGTERIHLLLELTLVVVDRLHRVHERVSAGMIESHFHNVTLRWREYHTRHPRLMLEAALIRSDDLYLRPAERDVVRPGVRNIREIEPH